MRYYTHTHGENKSLKSCTVLIEGKDTHDNCFKKDREKKMKEIYSLLKNLNAQPVPI